MTFQVGKWSAFLFAKDDSGGGGQKKQLELLQPQLSPKEIRGQWTRLKVDGKTVYIRHFLQRGLLTVAAGLLERTTKSEATQRTSFVLRFLDAIQRQDFLVLADLIPELTERDFFMGLVVGDYDEPWTNWSEFRAALKDVVLREIQERPKDFAMSQDLVATVEQTLASIDRMDDPTRPPQSYYAYLGAVNDGRTLAGNDVLKILDESGGNTQDRQRLSALQERLRTRLDALAQESVLTQGEANFLVATVLVAGASPPDEAKIREQLARFLRTTNGRGFRSIREVTFMAGIRAQYDSANAAIRLGSVHRSLELWHEGGHAVSEESGTAQRVQKGFVRARRESGGSVSLRALTGNLRHGKDEFAVPGDARNPYVLKNDGEEVVSMGAGDLASPSLASGAIEDPEQFFVTLSVLRGASY